jgi:dihydrofolate reductase
MPTGHVFMATSLDGFVARKDHSLDWLMKQNTDGEDHGFDDFMASVDGLIMGSGSFKTVLAFESWPYQKPVIVMSHSLVENDIPAELESKVRLTQLSPQELILSLVKEGWKRAYVDGGKLVQSFIRAGLVQDMTITSVPVLIGEGVRLFGSIDDDIDLELIGSKSFNSGLVQNHYRLI